MDGKSDVRCLLWAAAIAAVCNVGVVISAAIYLGVAR